MFTLPTLNLPFRVPEVSDKLPSRRHGTRTPTFFVSGYQIESTTERPTYEPCYSLYTEGVLRGLTLYQIESLSTHNLETGISLYRYEAERKMDESLTTRIVMTQKRRSNTDERVLMSKDTEGSQE